MLLRLPRYLASVLLIAAVVLPGISVAWDFTGVFGHKVVSEPEAVRNARQAEELIVKDVKEVQEESLAEVEEPQTVQQPAQAAKPEVQTVQEEPAANEIVSEITPSLESEVKAAEVSNPPAVLAPVVTESEPLPVESAPAQVVQQPVALPVRKAALKHPAKEFRKNFEELHFREVLFDFYQQQYFPALTKLGVSEGFDRLPARTAEADLLRGGMLLSWGQHQDAAKQFEAILANAEDSAIRDKSRFYLGRMQYQRGYFTEALNQFAAIEGELPAHLESEQMNLQAQVFLALGENQQAVDLLSDFESTENWAHFARYNLGVALISQGDAEQGAALLDEVGMIRVRDEELLALRDRANLALGYLYLQAGSESDARRSLRRIRLQGLSSNKALLGTGWADASANDYRQALAAWLELSDRNVLDSAVQESLLAVPYAFNRLGAIPQAAQYYARAIDVYDAEISRLDAVLDNDAGSHSLIDLLTSMGANESGWYWQLDAVPADAQTRYLYFAIADHRFHEGLKSYRELLRLKQHFSEWSARLDIYQQQFGDQQKLLAVRQPQLAESDLHKAVNDHKARQQNLRAQLQESLKPDTEVVSQQQYLQRQIEQDELEKLVMRNAIILEALRIRTEKRSESLATHGGRLEALTPKLAKLQQQINAVVERHEEYLQTILRDELEQQRQRIVSYRTHARFSLASVYDRLSAENR
ncbi:MAG: hypothetical protein ACR2QG_04610 [Gammaproteobacteria bacterium]